MTWTANMAFTAADILTVAELNSLADNLEETAPGKATVNSGYFVTAGPNRIAERIAVQNIDNNQGRTEANNYGDLRNDDPSPQVTALTGEGAIVLMAARLAVDSAQKVARVGYRIEGATSKEPDNRRCIQYYSSSANAPDRASVTYYDGRLTAGANTFTMEYKITDGVLTVRNRRLCVVPF